jgi:hypothetical protein
MPSQYSSARALFRALFNGDGGMVDMRAVRGGRVSQQFYDPDASDQIEAFADLFEDWNLYFGVGLRKDASSGAADNVSTIAALWADIDFKSTPEDEARARLDAFPLRPSAQVSTGGGWHLYWLLKEPMVAPDEAAEAAVLLRRIGATLQADLSSAEIAHVLRLPGTANIKYSPKRPVTLDLLDADRRYNPSDFEDACLADPDPEAARTGPFVLPTEPPTPSQRDPTLFKFGRSLKAKGMSEGQIRTALHVENERCRPPKTTKDVDAIVAKVMKLKDRKGFSLPVVEVPEEPARSEAPGAEPAEAPSNPTEAIDLAATLDATVATVRRFLVMTGAQADVVALWAALTHVADAFDIVPYLHVCAGTPRAGKSRLLEVLRYVVRRPWLAARTSAAALVRKLAKDEPTLLLDEVDTTLGTKTDYATALVGILNAGYTKHLTVTVCSGEGANITTKDFRVFGPKALCGIGSLPMTIADRSIPIRLRRKLKSETTERARDAAVRAAMTPLRRQFEQWGAREREALTSTRPAMPETLDDRALDLAEPLLAIAARAGGAWPERAEKAVVALLAGREAEEDVSTQLLSDIRGLIDAGTVKAVDGIAITSPLLSALEKLDDRPWATWSRGEPMTPHALAKLLRAFDVSTTQRWSKAQDKAVRGYDVEALAGAFARYLPPQAGEAGDDQ